jgi:hypothetical protein
MRAHPDLRSIIGAGVSAAKSVAPRLEIRHRFLARRGIAKQGPGVMLGPFTFTMCRIFNNHVDLFALEKCEQHSELT